MRKKICHRCGKIVSDTKPCSCLPDKRVVSAKSKEADKVLQSRKWRKLRERVLKRDNYMCQRCFIKYNIINNQDLEGHHIKSREDYPELTFEESNIICICKTCNLALEAKHLNHELDFEWNIDSDDEDFIL